MFFLSGKQDLVFWLCSNTASPWVTLSEVGHLGFSQPLKYSLRSLPFWLHVPLVIYHLNPNCIVRRSRWSLWSKVQVTSQSWPGYTMYSKVLLIKTKLDWSVGSFGPCGHQGNLLKHWLCYYLFLFNSITLLKNLWRVGKFCILC